jgi:hypothetical protein
MVICTRVAATPRLYDVRARCDLEGRDLRDRRSSWHRAKPIEWLANWAGANDLLLKPVDAFALGTRLQALIGADPVPYGDAGAAAAQVAAATQDHLV